MKNSVVLLSMFLSLPVFAASKTYNLKMDLSMEGKHVSSPQINVKEGEPALLTQEANGEKISMEVVVTGQEKAVVMNFVISTLTAKGEKKILAKPKITALENEKAEISVGTEKSKDLLSLSVTAKRTTL